MRQLNEYLSTKINGNSSFPIKPDHDEIIDFLMAHDFVEAKGDFSLPDYIIIYSKNHKEPFYIDDKNAIYFANGGKITEENPIFYCNTKLSDWIRINYTEFFSGITSQNREKVYKTYDAFRDRVNKFFGWQ